MQQVLRAYDLHELQRQCIFICLNMRLVGHALTHTSQGRQCQACQALQGMEVGGQPCSWELSGLAMPEAL